MTGRAISLSVLLVAAACGLGAVGLWAYRPVRTYWAEAERREVLHVRDGPLGTAIWGVWTGHSFAYGIETGPHSVVLIDAGSDPRACAITQQLAARDCTPADVHTIVLTHGHDEVQGGLEPFARAVVYVGPEDGMLARRDVLPKPWLARVQAKSLRTHRLPKKAMQPVWPGQRLVWGTQEARLVAVPGHTWGSFVVVFDAVAFVGDSLTGHDGPSGIPGVYGRALSVSPRHNISALKRLVHLPFSQVATTHAGVLPIDDAALSAWLETQSPADEPHRAPTHGGLGARGSTATTAGNG